MNYPEYMNAKDIVEFEREYNRHIDAEDIEQAYSTGADDDVYKTPDAQEGGPPVPAAPAPGGPMV